MAFPVSPAVVVREFDLTTVIPAVAQTPAAIAGIFRWGAVGDRKILGSESDLVTYYGKPTNLNPETWFTAANFLAYGGNLIVVRAADCTGVNAGSNTFVATNGVANVAWTPNTNPAALYDNVNTGMILFYSNNTTILDPASGNGVYVTAFDSGNVTLSRAPAGSGNLDLFFRENKTFTAVAQETQTPKINWAHQIVKDDTDYLSKDGYFDNSIQYVARFPGALGNSLRISQCDSAAQFTSTIDMTASGNAHINTSATYISGVVGNASLTFTFTPANTQLAADVSNTVTIATAVKNSLSLYDLIVVGNTSTDTQLMRVVSISNVATSTNDIVSFTVGCDEDLSIRADYSSNTFTRYWEFAQEVQVAPGQSIYQFNSGNSAAQDELHLVVVDSDGSITGVADTILEVYKGLSRATDAVNEGGQTNYYKNVINQQSKWIRWANDRSAATSATAAALTSSSETAPFNVDLYGGADGLGEGSVAANVIYDAYDKFSSPEDVDVGLILTGKTRGSALNNYMDLPAYLIQNIAEVRKDCVVFCSPDYNDVVYNVGNEATACVAARNSLPSSSYGFMDSGYKLQYDRYNNLQRWIPLNGDIAGLAARTDATNDPWWSFAGYNRGNIKNVTKLAWNPKLADRNVLYASSINPVVNEPGLGTILKGDKTLLTKPSAFDRINVRRLFIVLEKAIATAAKFSLFEFNDGFTQSQFRSMVKPFLTDVKGRRGLTDFLVVCDSTNNTPEVVVHNEFKAAIYIKPNYSINWVILDFVAVPPTVQFSEVIGQYGGG